MVVKEKFPYADLCPFPARPMTVDLWDNSPFAGKRDVSTGIDKSFVWSILGPLKV
jgi:hypothetical protein